jgi:hypothetical protein
VGDRIRIAGNQVNVPSAGVYFFPDKITTLDAVINFINCSSNITALITEQCNDSREPLMQRAATGSYLMGGKLVQKRSQLDRETVGEIDYADEFSYTIPARWGDTEINEKDFIEDADGVFYLVTSKRKMPSGVIVLSLTRIKA